VWTLQEDQVPERLWRHCESLVGFVEANLNVHREALVEEIILTTTNDADNDKGPIKVHDTPSPKQRNTNCTLFEFTSQGQQF